MRPFVEIMTSTLEQLEHKLAACVDKARENRKRKRSRTPSPEPRTPPGSPVRSSAPRRMPPEPAKKKQRTLVEHVVGGAPPAFATGKVLGRGTLGGAVAIDLKDSGSDGDGEGDLKTRWVLKESKAAMTGIWREAMQLHHALPPNTFIARLLCAWIDTDGLQYSIIERGDYSLDKAPAGSVDPQRGRGRPPCDPLTRR
jgi:hypothetical protein